MFHIHPLFYPFFFFNLLANQTDSPVKTPFHFIVSLCSKASKKSDPVVRFTLVPGWQLCSSMGTPCVQSWGLRRRGCHRCPWLRQLARAVCCHLPSRYSWGRRYCASDHFPWCWWLLGAVLSQRCSHHCLCEGCLSTTDDRAKQKLIYKQWQRCFSFGSLHRCAQDQVSSDSHSGKI